MPAAPADFRLYHSNDLELLAGLLAATLAVPAPDAALLAPDTILIPQPAMRRWLQKTLAEQHGIAANLRFLAPGEFVREALDANISGSDQLLGDAATLRWRLWALLADDALLADPVFAPLQAVLADDDRPLAAWALAGELANAFEKYQAWRRDWLKRWDRGGDRDDWQAELWRRAARGLSHRAARLDAYLSRFADQAAPAPRGLPARLFVFACQSVSPDVLRVIASASRSGCLHYYFFSPVAGWWGDLRSARERLCDGSSSGFDDGENPLLRANGVAGRDFVRTLFSYEVAHPTYEHSVYVPPDPETRSGLLHQLQRDLLARRAPPTNSEPLPNFAETLLSDRSLQVHACPTRLREIQVLHDQLRDLLERDRNLQPREIAVLAPNIDQYAPYIHAVFGSVGASLPPIPYAVSDSSALASEPLIAAFLRLLALPSARFCANDVLELLRLPAIAQRFGLDAFDSETLSAKLGEVGVRWGLDASHRQTLGAPAEAAYSWSWALDRLLLGYASGNDGDIAGVAPWPHLEGSALDGLDALLQGLRALVQLQQALTKCRDARQWQELLARILQDFFPERPLAADDRQALDYLRAQINAFARQTEAAELSQPLPTSVVRAWFQSLLAQEDWQPSLLGGGISFGRMVPLRLIPFKVICLLGMNDGDYPRRDPIGSLNRLSAQLGTAERRVGDRSIRDDDRLLFLQLLASATESFYLSYLGQDPRSGEILLPSLLISELLDVAARYFRDSQSARQRLTVQHPLQPFAAEAFGRGDARRLSYQASWRPEPSMHASERISLAPFVATLPWRRQAASDAVSCGELYRALAHPAKTFLRERLQLRLPNSDERLPDVEPFDGRDGRRRHALRQRIFQALTDGGDEPSETLCRRLLAEGRIAPGAAGAQEAIEIIARLAEPAKTWRSWAVGTARCHRFELVLGAYTLVGALDNIHDLGLLQFRAGRAHGRAQLALGIDALVWSALGETRPVHRLIADEIATALPTIPPEQARSALHTLLELQARSRQVPLPFMPKSGFAYVSANGAATAWAAAHSEWEKRDGSGEGQDPWVRLALRGHDPFVDADGPAAARFREIALAVFLGMPGLAPQGGAR